MIPCMRTTRKLYSWQNALKSSHLTGGPEHILILQSNILALAEVCTVEMSVAKWKSLNAHGKLLWCKKLILHALAHNHSKWRQLRTSRVGFLLSNVKYWDFFCLVLFSFHPCEYNLSYTSLRSHSHRYYLPQFELFGHVWRLNGNDLRMQLTNSNPGKVAGVSVGLLVLLWTDPDPRAAWFECYCE